MKNIKMINLSVVLAVYNEEERLATCLDSVKNLADEIIVVDGSSTDGTVAVAKQYHAKVIATTNKLMFHTNKQMAMDAANGDIILQLDADEVVDAELADFLRQVKENPAEFAVTSAWWIKRKNYFMNTWLRKGGQYPDPVIRLYWQGKASLPQKDVHEQMVVNGEVGWAAGHLEHYSSPTLKDYLRKMNTYTSVAAQQLLEQGVTPSIKTGIRFFAFKPLQTFLLVYFRHKGFVDKLPGFLFALLSGLHFPLQFLKLWELYEMKERR